VKNKPKLIVIVGVFIIFILGAGIYLNYQLTHTLNQSDRVLQNKNSRISSSQTRLSNASQIKSGFDKISGILEAKTDTPSQSNHNNVQLNLNRPANETLVTHVQNKIGQNIEKKDILMAGLILMRKLNKEDISYLSKVAMKDSYSQEDYRKSQEILLNKLSTNEINVLKKLGKKYGSELKILDLNANL
jgi:hypothetical protein